MHAVMTRPRVWLPVMGIAIAVLLDLVGRHQSATVLQDSPPFVPPAVLLSESLNAPASLLLGTMALLAHSIHIEQSFSRTPIPRMVFYGGVGLLWFFVSLEVGLRRTKTLSPRYRVISASAAVAVAMALASFGVAAWRQDQVALTLGCAPWSAVLTLFYSADLAHFTVSLSNRDDKLGNC